MKIIITAGGTTEKIDDVRTITNSSTGKLGAKIADRFFSAENVSIDHIYYICGHNAAAPRSDRVSIIRIGSVSELVSQIKEILAAEKIDVFIHSMAVSDYTVSSLTTKELIANKIIDIIKDSEALSQIQTGSLVKKITESAFASTDSLNHENKINSDINDLVVVMERTPKVIGMIKKLQPEIVLVGFKLLSNVNLSTLIDTGYNLLTKNNCDLVLANDLSQITTDSHTGYLIAGNKTYEKLDSKDAIARAIVERTVQVLECRNTE